MKRILKHLPWLLLTAVLLVQTAEAASFLVPVGKVIGLELKSSAVSVAAFDEQLGENARLSGLQVGDRILTINKVPIRCIQDVRQALQSGNSVAELNILRDQDLKTLKITPSITEKGPKLGIYLKDSISGIGTVTWYDPDTQVFGALGHGVSSRDGTLIQMTEGNAYDASIISVQKGKTGQPGQLLGSMDGSTVIGKLEKNTPQGIFGTSKSGWLGEKLPVADPSQVETGPAVIRATVGGKATGEYQAEILKIYPASGSVSRNMLLKITDPRLLSTTGGIVQGMSGSPIIQNGRLVGAVTHVLVNDPTTGYGIFVENMLNAA